MDKYGYAEIRTTHFVWEVTDFSTTCTEVGEYIESPLFSANEAVAGAVKWQLALYPHGKNNDCEGYLSLDLSCYFSGSMNECDISYGFYIWGDQNEVTTRKVKLSKATNSVECLKFKPREGLEIKRNLFVWKGTLKIGCRIDEIIRYYTHKGDEHAKLIENIDPLFLSDIFSDVSIEVEGKQLKAHKNILAVRSDVFLAMLTHNTIERKESIIRITDFSYDVMKEVLRFIYCGTVHNLETHKEDLLAAADKYNLQLLKKICGQSIWMSASADQIWEVLNMSDLYNCKKLKMNAINYIAENLNRAIQLPGYNEVSQSNPKLIGELLRETAKYHKMNSRAKNFVHSCL